MSQLLPPDMQEEFQAILAQHMPCKNTGEIDNNLEHGTKECSVADIDFERFLTDY